jgi:acetyl esterase/lipase
VVLRSNPVLLTVILLVSAGSGFAQDPAPSARWLELLEAFSEAGIIRHADIPYDAVEGVHPARLSLDVYTDPDLTRAPVLLFIHGGSWQRGSKRAIGQKPLRFTAEGFVVVASNYRFRPQVEVPDMARDVAAAVAWIKEGIGELGGDPSRIFLMGHSAGAHLVALVGTNGSYLESQGLKLGDLSGVVVLDTGPFNVERQIHDIPPRGYGLMLRAVFGEKPEGWPAASPWHHVAPGKGIPPFLVFYHQGRGDAPRQAIPFVQRLKEAGVDAEVVQATGKTHGSLNQDMGADGDEPTALTLAFMKKNIDRGKGSEAVARIDPGSSSRVERVAGDSINDSAAHRAHRVTADETR